MKAKELLKVDFSKYERVMINGVTTRGLKIVSEEGYLGSISILGLIDGNLMLTAHYDEDDEITFVEDLEDSFLSIRRKVV